MPRTKRSRTGKRTPKRLPNPLTPDEVQALMAQVNPKAPTGLRNRALLQTMVGAGLRLAETLALKPGDVDLDAGRIRVNQGKGAKDRVVPIGGETVGWLRTWAERRATYSLNGRQALFCTLSAGRNTHPRTRKGRQGFAEKTKTTQLKPGGRLNPRYVEALVRRLAERAGIEKRVTPHVLRHTFATRMLDEGLNIREVQTLLGHSNVANTQIYTHVHPDALAERVQALDPLDGQGDEAAADVTPDVGALAENLAALPAETRAALIAALGGMGEDG